MASNFTFYLDHELFISIMNRLFFMQRDIQCSYIPFSFDKTHLAFVLGDVENPNLDIWFQIGLLHCTGRIFNAAFKLCIAVLIESFKFLSLSQVPKYII